MKGALDVHRELLARDVPHEVIRVRGTPAVDADDLPRALGVPATCCVAVRCYVTDVGFVAVAVQAGTLPDPAAALDAVRARTLRAATAGEVNAATDYAAGLVSPIGLPVDVQLLADAVLGATEVLYCPLGESGVALGIRPRDLLLASRAKVTSFLPVPLPRAEMLPWDGAGTLDAAALGRTDDGGRAVNGPAYDRSGRRADR